MLVDLEQSALWRSFEEHSRTFEKAEERDEYLADCAEKIETFKAGVLPVMKYIEDTGKLVVVSRGEPETMTRA